MMASDSHPNSVTGDNAVDRPIAAPRLTGAAQRQWVYRLRRKRAVIDAIGNETEASRATLLALLSHELATLESRTASLNTTEPARNTARRVLNEIITRYAIKL